MSIGNTCFTLKCKQDYAKLGKVIIINGKYIKQHKNLPISRAGVSSVGEPRLSVAQFHLFVEPAPKKLTVLLTPEWL